MNPDMRTFFWALPAIVLALSLTLGCTNRKAAAREQAEAKARADAVRREMEQLPKTFKSPPLFKRNEPEKKSERAPDSNSRR